MLANPTPLATPAISAEPLLLGTFQLTATVLPGIIYVEHVTNHPGERIAVRLARSAHLAGTPAYVR